MKNLLILAVFVFSSVLIAACDDGGSSAPDDVDPSTVIKGTMTDSRDGQIYKTLTIGSRTWMAENLNYAYLLPTAEEDSSSFCYNNELDGCAQYGRLYLWSAAMDSAAAFSKDGIGCGYGGTCSAYMIVRGVCPEGWHLPSKDEWKSLITAVGGINSAGTKLKSVSDWSNGGNGEDSYGFSVLPAGVRDGYRDLSRVGDVANFWSSSADPSENHSYHAFYLFFHYSFAHVYAHFHDVRNAFSVRCIKD